jgi:hypothetical protein
MRKWLARLAFSFLVIAAACAWEAARGNHSDAKRWTLGIVAALSCGLALAGFRERYREPDDDDADPS